MFERSKTLRWRRRMIFVWKLLSPTISSSSEDMWQIRYWQLGREIERWLTLSQERGLVLWGTISSLSSSLLVISSCSHNLLKIPSRKFSDYWVACFLSWPFFFIFCPPFLCSLEAPYVLISEVLIVWLPFFTPLPIYDLLSKNLRTVILRIRCHD